MTILWRGISKEHPSYQKALQGKAESRGGHDNTKNIMEVIQKVFPTTQNQLILSEDIFYEDEVLVVGIVEDAKVHLIEIIEKKSI